MLSSGDPSRIAVFQALNLGDFLCATPALRTLRRRFSTSEIAFIGRPWARELVARLPSVDRFIEFPGYPGIAESPERAIRRSGTKPTFDLAIQMHGSGEISNGFAASLAPVSVGFGPPDDRRMTTVLAWVENEPEPLRWLRLVDAVGAPHVGLSLELPTTTDERARAQQLIGPDRRAPIIGLHVGASDPRRRWPLDCFARLARQLIDRFGARIVLTGAVEERALTRALCGSLDRTPIDLAGKTGLGEFAAVIAYLDLLVTNDTGASHVAAATRTPSVVLFGPTRPERWGPLDRKLHTAIDAASIHDCCEDGAAALASLPVATVYDACHAALNPKPVVMPLEQVVWAG